MVAILLPITGHSLKHSLVEQLKRHLVFLSIKRRNSSSINSHIIYWIHFLWTIWFNVVTVASFDWSSRQMSNKHYYRSRGNESLSRRIFKVEAMRDVYLQSSMGSGHKVTSVLLDGAAQRCSLINVNNKWKTFHCLIYAPTKAWKNIIVH